LNPAQFTGNKALEGQLAGSMDATVGVRNLGAPAGRGSRIDDVSVDGKLSLQPSSIGGLRIDSANVDGQYANRAGNIRQLTLTGPDVQIKANGAISLGDQGQSNLRYDLATPSLATIGKLVDKPLEGAASVSGQVTGNGSALRTTGTLKAANLGYGATAQALNLTSEYDVSLPNLDAAQAKVGATTTATFVKAAGQEINKVTARTTYAGESLDFDTTLEQPKRSLTAAGNVVLHPQHQEVHLRRLGLQAGTLRWDTAPGTEPAIDYGGDTLTVKNFRLVSGSQEITAAGTIGPRSSNLQARLSNFDLANVDALMLTNRQLGGVLNAQATITGPRDALRVAGQFDVTGGAFRQFKYQSLTGKVDFAANRIGLDARLQENAQAWVTAAGSIPTAVFSAAPPPADAAQPVDLRVDSSSLDLGLVQGFTTAVQNATGTARLNLRVTGTAGDPRMAGGLEIDNGGFKVVPTGVTYSNLKSRILLQPDRVTIQNLSITDNHKATLTLSGDLALHERQLGGVNVAMRGQDFKVVDNELGNVRINSDVKIGGEVRAPRITGTLGINTGTINIDKVLDLATSSAYSTSAETVATTEGGQPASQPIGQPVNQPAREAAAPNKLPETPAEHDARKAAATPAPASTSPGPYDAATIDLRFTVPDDLVIKGNDIRVGQSSVGMGNVNLTLGGNMRMQKGPGDAVRLLGEVRTIRGTYDFQGRRFDIQRDGTVRFEGFEPPNPSLDITATRVISGVEARVHVGGNVRRPQLSLTSNPPLDEADVLSLIIFGQPSNQLGEGQQVSLAQRAGALASGFVAGKLAQSIGSALNLDTFEIQTGSDTGESGATVTIGEQVGQRLYVKLRQGVGSDNMSEFVLDYQLTNFLRFESTMTQGGTPTRNIMQPVAQSGADLIFLFSF
jgi:autotransporter translocation and assembly factor TamB